jgi:hypothetical protein
MMMHSLSASGLARVTATALPFHDFYHIVAEDKI